MKSKHAELLNRVQSYSKETGIPVQDCINEALEEWVECCMGPRLEAFRKRPVGEIPIIMQDIPHLVKAS